MKVFIDNTEILNIDITSQQLLENDLLNIGDWVKNAIVGKVENCYGRFRKEWDAKLFNDPSVESIPANRDAFVEFVTAREDYKNRSMREAEEAAIAQQLSVAEEKPE